MGKKFKTFEGFWIIKSFFHMLKNKLPEDYDPFTPRNYKPPVSKSHFFKIEKFNSKKKATPNNSIKVCSWNLFYGKYSDYILRTIKNDKELKDVDVFLLQEVPRNHKINNKRNLAKEFAEHFGFSYVYGVITVSVDEKGKYIGDMGNAIISRYPIINSKIFRLKNIRARWDFDPKDFNVGNRLALLVTLKTDLGNVDFVNIHLDSIILEKQRKEQLEHFMESFRLEKFSEKEVIGGDFNSYLLKEKSVRNVMISRDYQNIFGNKFIKTHSFFIPMHMDHIYVKNIKVIKSKVLKHIIVSDHYPIIAELKV